MIWILSTYSRTKSTVHKANTLNCFRLSARAPASTSESSVLPGGRDLRIWLSALFAQIKVQRQCSCCPYGILFIFLYFVIAVPRASFKSQLPTITKIRGAAILIINLCCCFFIMKQITCTIRRSIRETWWKFADHPAVCQVLGSSLAGSRRVTPTVLSTDAASAVNWKRLYGH